MKPKVGVIYNKAQCNFCKEKDKDVQYLNFQAICEVCANEHFTPILKTFRKHRKEKMNEQGS